MVRPHSQHLRLDPSAAISSNNVTVSATSVRARQPQHVIRTLKMPLLRKDVDDRGPTDESDVESHQLRNRKVSVQSAGPARAKTPSTVSTPQGAGKAKRKSQPATVVDQLKHCLAQYELIQKQLLCAELTGTVSSNHQRFERAAEKLIGRITSLRKKLTTKAETMQRLASLQSSKSEQKATANPPQISKVDPAVVGRTSSPVSTKRTIKLSVSQPTAKVLKAFADAGKRPSVLVERALWADRDVQDAALLLNLKTPVR